MYNIYLLVALNECKQIATRIRHIVSQIVEIVRIIAIKIAKQAGRFARICFGRRHSEAVQVARYEDRRAIVGHNLIVVAVGCCQLEAICLDESHLVLPVDRFGLVLRIFCHIQVSVVEDLIGSIYLHIVVNRLYIDRVNAVDGRVVAAAQVG